MLSSSRLIHHALLPAIVVTMEPKYAVSTKIAEFYCMLTSPFFALPTLLLLFYPVSAIPAPTALAIIVSLLAAICSTLYHATLYNLFSTLDACVAVITFYANTMAVMAVVPGSSSWWQHPQAAPTVILTLVGLFIFHWESTAFLATALMALLLPVCAFGYIDVEEYAALALGLLGILCFLLDRKGICRSHPWWHVFGGMSLFLGLHETILLKEKATTTISFN